jgi:hypothetical protein
MGVKMGDLCIVEYKGTWSSAIVADVGPHNKYGEGSVALANSLHIPSSPRNGGTEAGVRYIIFPDTALAFGADFSASAFKAFDDWGGKAKVTEAFGS